MSVKKVGKKHVNSRSHFEGNKNMLKCKRSQVTIFVILALLIIGVIIILLFPQIKKAFVPTTPNDLVPKECMEKAVRETLAEVMKHGGKLNPELYFNYNNVTINYLCYTQEWYKGCIMQNPFLKQSIEKEVKNNVQTKIAKCISDMETSLRNKGYEIKTTGTKKANIELVPKKIVITPDVSMIATKGEETYNFPSSRFQVEAKSSSYELIMLVTSVLGFEAGYGDSIPELYMYTYPNIRVQKTKQEDGTKIYVLSDRDTGEYIRFATRSVAWPPGMIIYSDNGEISIK